VQVAQAARTFLDIGFQVVGHAKVAVVALLLFQVLPSKKASGSRW
jgi:hypothetical protein